MKDKSCEAVDKVGLQYDAILQAYMKRTQQQAKMSDVEQATIHDIPDAENGTKILSVSFVQSDILSAHNAVAMIENIVLGSSKKDIRTINLVCLKIAPTIWSLRFPNSLPDWEGFPTFEYNSEFNQIRVIGVAGQRDFPEGTTLFDYLKATL